ncbi:hypothetical protein EDEG_02272 [Edhazardia aedis USNM 41457]|uniref:Uncharacterized protein n=1 Tax=Edhazardia aedis (strain USNM 41457) TaxID=1003232 RepID=J9D777_EDHAE|nr:hypothetical protein EDEG_02272 [Edhazardia aedis USNM 41457]|eukprot:EJW03384.1 hypothetical protein EDEG_02272 [Edhazardia aedis USNM 41457]
MKYKEIEKIKNLKKQLIFKILIELNDNLTIDNNSVNSIKLEQEHQQKCLCALEKLSIAIMSLDIRFHGKNNKINQYERTIKNLQKDKVCGLISLHSNFHDFCLNSINMIFLNEFEIFFRYKKKIVNALRKLRNKFYSYNISVCSL